MTVKKDIKKRPHPEWEYRDLFTIRDSQGGNYKIKSPQDWPVKCEQVKEAILSVFGEFPPEKCPLSPEIIEEKQVDNVIIRTIEYNVESDDRIRSYLTLPADLEPGKKIPVVLALHATEYGWGGKSCFKYEGNPDREIARILPSKGMAVLAPDGITSGTHVYPGEKPLDTDPFYKKHSDWSIMGKLIYDAMRSIDYIETLEFADTDRIGAVGHSLGGYWAMFTAAFDQRVSVAVSSCGFVPFRADTNSLSCDTPCRWARYKGYNHAPKMARYWEENIQPPFDFHEVIAAIAPRPFLNVSGFRDKCFPETSGVLEVSELVKDVYNFLGVPQRFKNHMFDGPHDHFEADEIYGWLVRWLKDDG